MDQGESSRPIAGGRLVFGAAATSKATLKQTNQPASQWFAAGPGPGRGCVKMAERGLGPITLPRRAFLHGSRRAINQSCVSGAGEKKK